MAFLQGRRGVSILQLYKGWDDRSAAQQPLLRPFVLRFLQQATEDKGVAMLPSLAPQGLGMSLLLAAKQQPFRARAELLAKVGVQSALVADSPYYKILVGTILGYKEENILHHVQVILASGWCCRRNRNVALCLSNSPTSNMVYSCSALNLTKSCSNYL